jgi:hypothetical protein
MTDHHKKEVIAMSKTSKKVEEVPDDPDELEEAEAVEEDEEEETDEEEEDEDEEEEEEDDEEEEDEEEEDDEEEEEKPVTVKSKVRARKREDRAKRLRNRVVLGVIAIIFIGAVVGIYMYTPGPDTASIRQLNEPSTEGINMIISTTGGGVRGYTGKATVKATVDGNVTYNHQVNVKENIAYLDLKYSDFVTQNGVYTFSVSAGGKTGTTDVTINSVVEDISYTIGTRDTDEHARAMAKTVVTVYMTFIRWTSPTANTSVEASIGSSLSLEITDPAGQMSTKPNLAVAGKGLVKYEFNATSRGSYNIKATFVNSQIKTDSKYWSVVKPTDLLINSRPMAEAGADQSKTVLPPVTINVDGSGSRDDGAVVTYEWNFGVYTDPSDANFGKDTIKSTSPTASWTYTAIGDYTVTLTVTDNGLSGVANSAKQDTDWLIVSIA